MSIEDITSPIPTPVAKYGRAIPQEVQKQIVYNGLPLPKFLLDYGVEPTQVREFLRLNRIGSAFDLEMGRIVILPQSKTADFSTHPEA